MTAEERAQAYWASRRLEREDPLSPARGAVYGVACGIAAWLLIFGIAKLSLIVAG